MKIAIRIAPSTRLKWTGFSMLPPRNDPSPLVPSTGATRKSPKPSTRAKPSVKAISFLESSSSSPSAMLVERVSAFMPSQRVSPKDRAPRIIGSLKSLLRRVTDRKRSARRSSSPVGVRTAIPQKLGERISTPSIMACPPTLTALSVLLPVPTALTPLFEALHPAAGVHDALPARVERVARAGDVELDQRVGGAILALYGPLGLDRRAAQEREIGASITEDHGAVLGVYPFFHTNLSLKLRPLVYYTCKGTRRLVRAALYLSDALQLAQELGVGSGLLELLDEELYLLGGVEGVQDAANLPDSLGLRRLHQQLLLAGTRVLDVYRRVDPAVRQFPVEPQLHVARALELLEDDLVHPATGFDQRGRQY